MAAQDATPLWVRLIHRQSRKNAKVRGIYFSITQEELNKMVNAQMNKCAVTGISFDMTPTEKGIRRPWYPSLDRVSNEDGYTVKNCRLVCVAVNYAMNTWGEGVLRIIAKSMLGIQYDKETIDVLYKGRKNIPGVRRRPVKSGNVYQAYIWDGVRQISLGTFSTPEMAYQKHIDAKRIMERDSL